MAASLCLKPSSGMALPHDLRIYNKDGRNDQAVTKYYK
jgi:hypothetical protein